MPFGTGEGGDDDSLIERSQHHRLHARRRPKTMEGYAEVDAGGLLNLSIDVISGASRSRTPVSGACRLHSRSSRT
jgi:hypothetical protein